MLSIVWGPILFGFLFGFIVGTRIHRTEKYSFTLTAGAIVAILIGSIIFAFNVGQFPFYADLPLSTSFISAIVGILCGILLFGNLSKGDN